MAMELSDTEPSLPSDVWAKIWDLLPLKQYPEMRKVCARWYCLYRARNNWKFWNSLTLTQTVHEKGIATVPVLPNRKWHGRLFSYVGAQRVPYYFCDYEMGEKHGDSMYFFTKTAQPRITCSWHRNKLHGDWREYSLLGQLLTWKQYVMGKQNGHERTYNPLTGKIQSDVQWCDGKKHGVAKYWRWDTGLERTTRYFVMGVEMADVETFLRMSGAIER